MATRTAEKREPWALRMTETEKAAIKARAEQAGLDMTTYMIRCALGEIADSDMATRVKSLEQRMQRMEEIAFAG